MSRIPAATARTCTECVQLLLEGSFPLLCSSSRHQVRASLVQSGLLTLGAGNERQGDRVRSPTCMQKQLARCTTCENFCGLLAGLNPGLG